MADDSGRLFVKKPKYSDNSEQNLALTDSPPVAPQEKFITSATGEVR